ncbi:YbaK/EbsC family protein [Stenoxybacter acetivorans]|uniref:YbaK/EbsC family protein n=1 Tax=Stenoxybacter acetivorans TaxID=422441 RepID=UPI000561C981|nr:YbaK/EbsC family protein [Stenoxybacter acetivorans]
MNKSRYPTTQAIRFLRAHQAVFKAHEYAYIPHGGTAQSAAALGVDEHAVIKTIVLQNELKQGLIVLMHGDKQISVRQLARDLNMKHLEPAPPEQANKWTGFLVGGTSPFGIKTPLPIYAEAGIFDLPEIYINGGKRGLLVAISPDVLYILKPTKVQVAID